jgi:hypothetical protein
MGAPHGSRCETVNVRRAQCVRSQVIRGAVMAANLAGRYVGGSEVLQFLENLQTLSELRPALPGE